MVSSAKDVAKPAVGLLQLLQPRPHHLALRVDMSSDETTLLPNHVYPTPSSLEICWADMPWSMRASSKSSIICMYTVDARGISPEMVIQAFRSNNEAKS